MINIPFLLLIILSSISLGIEIAKHGRPRTGNYSGWGVLISLIIEWGLIIWGIMWGGFS